MRSVSDYLPLRLLAVWNRPKYPCVDRGPLAPAAEGRSMLLKTFPEYHVVWFHSDRPTWKIMWKKQSTTFTMVRVPNASNNHWGQVKCEWELVILHWVSREHEDEGKSSQNIISITKVSMRCVLTNLLAIETVHKNCWIALERSKMTFISIHIIANQKSYHEDKST